MASIADLGRLVKFKHPEYADMPDDVVGSKVKSKFPGSYDDFTDAVPGMERLGGTPPGPHTPPKPAGIVDTPPNFSGSAVEPGIPFGGLVGRGVQQISQSIPAFANSFKRGASDLMEGTAKVLSPLAIPALVSAPVATLGAGVFGGAADLAGRGVAQIAGGDPETQRFVGDLAAGATAAGSGRMIKGVSDLWQTANPKIQKALINMIPVMGPKINVLREAMATPPTEPPSFTPFRANPSVAKRMEFGGPPAPTYNPPGTNIPRAKIGPPTPEVIPPVEPYQPFKPGSATKRNMPSFGGPAPSEAGPPGTIIPRTMREDIAPVAPVPQPQPEFNKFTPSPTTASRMKFGGSTSGEGGGSSVRPIRVTGRNRAMEPVPPAEEPAVSPVLSPTGAPQPAAIQPVRAGSTPVEGGIQINSTQQQKFHDLAGDWMATKNRAAAEQAFMDKNLTPAKIRSMSQADIDSLLQRTPNPRTGNMYTKTSANPRGLGRKFETIREDIAQALENLLKSAGAK